MDFCVGDSLQVEPLGSYTSTQFQDVYEMDESLNSGQFGEVYKAHLISHPDEYYAVKVIDRDHCDDEKILFETKLLHDLRTVPNVVRIMDFFVTDENMYLVQTLAGGGDVFDRIIEKKLYTEHDARNLLNMLLTTVQTLHERGIVHRDIKPENILLRTKQEDSHILLCDFGEAKYLPKEPNEGLFSFVGSPEYVAPEIVEGIPYREEVDMWSIGSLLFMLLAGHSPFEGYDNSETYQRISVADYSFDDAIWQNITDDAKHLISKLLTLDRKHRWSAKQALESDWFGSPTVVDTMAVSTVPVPAACTTTTLTTTENLLEEEKEELDWQQLPQVVVETNIHQSISADVAPTKAAIHVQTTWNLEDSMYSNYNRPNKDDIPSNQVMMREMVKELLPDYEETEETEETEDGAFPEDDLLYVSGIRSGQFSYLGTIVTQMCTCFGL